MEHKRLQREVDDLEAQVRKLQSAAEDEESRDLHSKEFARLRVRLVGSVGSDTSGSGSDTSGSGMMHWWQAGWVWVM